MSVIEDTKFKCPFCEEVFESKMYKSVVVQENNEYRDMLVNGSYFKYTCPKCGKSFMAVYPLSYADIDNRFILQYTPRDQKEDIIEFVKQNKDKMASNYTVRVCDATYDMVEKMVILQNRLDDRAVEICKVIIHKGFKKQFPDKVVNHIYVNYDDKGHLFYDVIFLEDEKEMVSRAPFDIKMYNQIYRDFRKYFTDDDLYIDYEYGLNLMMKGPKEK